MNQRQWTNESVRAMAAGRDPLQAASDAAAQLLAEAERLGVAGPPLDVFAFAAEKGIKLRARSDLTDAQLSTDDSGLTIRYNPNRPRGRLRFSIAHELAHAVFPDAAEQLRHRTPTGAVDTAGDTDSWELELVCDVIAAELLLPERAVQGILNVDPDIDFLMEVRRRWDVSTEAMLRRVTSATLRPLVLVAASRPGDGSDTSVRVDYVVRSESAAAKLPGLFHGATLADVAPVLACTAVGQTSRGDATIGGDPFYVQAVGTPPYPGQRWPRVLALIEPADARRTEPNLSFVTGDLLDVDGDAPVVFAHVVSDAMRGWARFGVAGALGRAFPDFAGVYRSWTLAHPDHLQLGSMHYVSRDVGGRPTGVASLVVQSGFGRGSTDRLHYDALDTALKQLRVEATRADAVVHVPRLGAGRAGGRWDRVEELLSANLVQEGVPVVVHTLPAGTPGGSR